MRHRCPFLTSWFAVPHPRLIAHRAHCQARSTAQHQPSSSSQGRHRPRQDTITSSTSSSSSLGWGLPRRRPKTSHVSQPRPSLCAGTCALRSWRISEHGKRCPGLTATLDSAPSAQSRHLTLNEFFRSQLSPSFPWTELNREREAYSVSLRFRRLHL